MRRPTERDIRPGDGHVRKPVSAQTENFHDRAGERRELALADEALGTAKALGTGHFVVAVT